MLVLTAEQIPTRHPQFINRLKGHFGEDGGVVKRSRPAYIAPCAASVVAPLADPAWLQRRTFVDAVGSFSLAKRKTEDHVVLRAPICVDALEDALRRRRHPGSTEARRLSIRSSS